MKLKEMDQFITDPEPSKDAPKMLVDPIWLHQVLRKLHEQDRLVSDISRTNNALRNEVSSLKHRLMVAESGHPYTQLINTRV